MIERTNTGVNFLVEGEDLIKSISLLTALRDFCLEQKNVDEGKQETAKALTTAIETMQAFWCEKFGED